MPITLPRNPMHNPALKILTAAATAAGLLVANPVAGTPSHAAAGQQAVPSPQQSPQQPPQQSPRPVTAGALPTPQTNGIVFTIAIVGDVAYAGGQFTRARPAGVEPGGAGTVTRHNLLAFNVRTGRLLPWAPDVSGTVFAADADPGPYCRSVVDGWVCDTVFRIEPSPDGGEIYVGGDFTSVNGQRRTRVAAFDTGSGRLDPRFHPSVSSRVRGLAITAHTVYIGGAFTSVNGKPRSRLAALTKTGRLRPWAPKADGPVFTLLDAPQQGRVLIGGAFDTVNGARHHGIMAVDAKSGENAGWHVTLPTKDDTVTDIETDGSGTAYFSGYSFRAHSKSRFEGRAAVDIASGRMRWFDGCYGDTQSITIANGILYSASHTHSCPELGIPKDTPYRRLLAETTRAVSTAWVHSNNVHVGDPVPRLLPWLPNTNGGPEDSHWDNGPWAIASNSSYVVVGGEFTTVNGRPQQSLTRFAARGVPGAVNNGPQYPFAAPQVTRDPDTGQVTVTWQATWDAQNAKLTYRLYRVGTRKPVYTVTAKSWPWRLPKLRFVDRGAPRHGDVEYWVKAVDADGVAIGSPDGGLAVDR